MTELAQSRRAFLTGGLEKSAGRSALVSRLRKEIQGEIYSDAASRGRYATDASIYQIMPIAVAVPRTELDARIAIEIARDLKVPLLPRGAGTSQCGQTVGEALVIDHSKYLRNILEIDLKAMTAVVQPGVVLDHLNAALKPHGVWFPVDVSTAAQCTIGGMAGNNSCGSRSLFYGNMVHNVEGIHALLADGTRAYFGRFGDSGDMALVGARMNQLIPKLFQIAGSVEDEIKAVWPKVMRRLGGYNLDIFFPQSERPYLPNDPSELVNFAHLLVGSEGTLAYFESIKLKLAPLPKVKVLGVVNFPTFHQAMAFTQHIVKLGPVAVELVDRNMIELSRANPLFAPVIETALTRVQGQETDALLLVEFAGDMQAPLLEKLRALDELMGDLGLPGSVVQMTDAKSQSALWEVRKYKGAFSGEHGDGLVRSEWVQWQFGDRITQAFEQVKDAFDPDNLMNPGKIVRCTKIEGTRLFRDESGVFKAIEKCNNNGHCRKFDAGTMCPSYRVTRDEQHSVRGRANTLRLALSGQLGADAWSTNAVRDALDLCVGCKGCKRECPTGVDMARMKIEALVQYGKRVGFSRKDQMVAMLPQFALRVAAIPGLGALLNLRNRFAWLRALQQRFMGISARRMLPKWRRDTFVSSSRGLQGRGDPSLHDCDVVLWADTFNNAFEPEHLRAALAVMQALGVRVAISGAAAKEPLCCGRTALSVGMINEAKLHARKTLAALKPAIDRGVPVVGLEPSCILSLRDEWLSMGLGPDAERLSKRALLFEEWWLEWARNNPVPPVKHALPEVLVHGHCHQKAMGAISPTLDALRSLGALPRLIETSCCGMAGSFGYDAQHYELSMKMAEANLLPAVRQASPQAIIVADGFSCRHQIADGAQRGAVHVSQVIAKALGVG